MAGSISMSAAPSPEAHAGLMDRVYRRQRYVYDFTRKYYLFGRDRLIAGLALEPHANLVEIGCGTARNLIAIARAYPQTRLYGLDASAAMLETARAAVRRAGLEHRITLAQGLAEQLSPAQFGAAHFENVLFSYSLSMIPDWRAALAAGYAALSPRGRMHVVDFGDLTGLGRLPEARHAGMAEFIPRYASRRISRGAGEITATQRKADSSVWALCLSFLQRKNVNRDGFPRFLWRKDHMLPDKTLRKWRQSEPKAPYAMETFGRFAVISQYRIYVHGGGGFLPVDVFQTRVEQ